MSIKIGYGLTLCAIVALASCQQEHTTLEPLAIEDNAQQEVATVRLSVADGATVGSAIHSAVLCGSTTAGTLTNAGLASGGSSSFSILHYDGTKSLCIATNLTTADQARVKAADIATLNTMRFNTVDYLPTPSSTAPVPMVAMLVNKSWEQLKKEESTSSIQPLTRAFALVDYTVTLPSTSHTLVHVAVKNIPAQFSLVTAIDNYDQTGNPYLSYDLGTQSSGMFFLPENKVAYPVFYDADANGMTYIEVQYKDPATAEQVHTAKYRIAEYAFRGAAHYGHLKRNNIYTCAISITANTNTNTIQFIN